MTDITHDAGSVPLRLHLGPNLHAWLPDHWPREIMLGLLIAIAADDQLVLVEPPGTERRRLDIASTQSGRRYEPLVLELAVVDPQAITHAAAYAQQGQLLGLSELVRLDDGVAAARWNFVPPSAVRPPIASIRQGSHHTRPAPRIDAPAHRSPAAAGEEWVVVFEVSGTLGSPGTEPAAGAYPPTLPSE
jgi:hypothetical protein